MALKGDTVRLEVQFKTFDDTVIDPTDVQLNIYGSEGQVINSFILREVDRLDVGKYFYDYTLPYDQDSISYEFFGKHYGKPIIARRKIDVEFVY